VRILAGAPPCPSDQQPTRGATGIEGKGAELLARPVGGSARDSLSRKRELARSFGSALLSLAHTHRSRRFRRHEFEFPSSRQVPLPARFA